MKPCQPYSSRVQQRERPRATTTGLQQRSTSPNDRERPRCREFASRGSGVQIPSAPRKPAGQRPDVWSRQLAPVRFARFRERQCPILGADLDSRPAQTLRSVHHAGGDGPTYCPLFGHHAQAFRLPSRRSGRTPAPRPKDAIHDTNTWTTRRLKAQARARALNGARCEPALD